MPEYEFQCMQCNARFTQAQSFSEHDRHKAATCPKCGSKKVRQLISPAHVQTAKKS